MNKQHHLTLEQIFKLGKPGGEKAADLFSSSKLSDSAAHLCIYEDSDLLELPTIVVPADDDIESFFADVATYFPERTPVSAFMHVLRETSRHSFRASIHAKDISGKRSLSVLIGLILGDALSAQRTAGNTALLPSYSSCKRTLAYCIARAIVLYPELSSQEISERWIRIRGLSGMDASTDAAESTIWAINLITGPSPQVDDSKIRGFMKTLGLYLRNQAHREQITESLISLYPSIAQSAPLLNGAFEKRIDAFSAIVGAVRQESKGSGLDSICIAYFCDLILPGSMAHSALIDRLLAEMPDGLLWYGLFAGSSKEFSLTSSVGGVGQKILRDLVAPFDLTQRPTCDISFDEYEVLSRVPLRSELLKPTQAKALLVSLYPGVEIYVRATTEDDESERPSLANVLIEQDERANRVRQLLWQADQLLRFSELTPAPARASLKGSKKSRQK